MSTTSSLPPYEGNSSLSTDEKKTHFLSTDDASSVYSTDQSQSDGTFKADKAFQLDTKGRHWNDFLTATKEVEIGVIELGAAGQGDVETYKNVRLDKYKGNCILYLNNKDGSGRTPVAETTHSNMPGRHTVVKLFSLSSPQESLIEQFELKSKPLSYSVLFTSTRFGSFIWRYGARKEKNAFKSLFQCSRSSLHELLILEKFVGGAKGKETVDVARMLRGDDTRAKGSSKHYHEGNGGRLEIDFGALIGGNVTEAGVREMEAFVVSTCFVMLKREIDNLEGAQAVVLT